MHIKTPRYRVQCLVFTASHTLADWIALASPNTPWAISTSVCFRALRFPPRQTSTTWKRLKYAQPACSGSWWQCWQFALASYSSTACHYPACCHYALLLTFSKVIIKPEQIVAQIIIIVQIVPQIIIIIQIASKTCTAHIHLSGAELPLSHICVAQNNMLVPFWRCLVVFLSKQHVCPLLAVRSTWHPLLAQLPHYFGAVFVSEVQQHREAVHDLT